MLRANTGFLPYVLSTLLWFQLIRLRYQNHNLMRDMYTHAGVYAKPGQGQPVPTQMYPWDGGVTGRGSTRANRNPPPGPDARRAAMLGWIGWLGGGLDAGLAGQ